MEKDITQKTVKKDFSKSRTQRFHLVYDEEKQREYSERNRNFVQKKEMTLKENSIATLPVVRVADFGAFLSAVPVIPMMIFCFIMHSRRNR